jgi:quercetin dioxygenase-like cupin family protein
MRKLTVLAFAASFVLVGALLGQEAGAAKKAPKAGAGTPIFTHSGDVKWMDLDPTGAPGVKIADVWGDHTKGGYGAFLKFPAGFLTPLHTHTHAIKIVVISGTYTQMPEGKAEERMAPGSYVFQPGGNYKHISGCDKASECELFIESSGKFDLKPVEAAKAPAKKK